MSRNFGEAVDNYWAIASTLFDTEAYNTYQHIK